MTLKPPSSLSFSCPPPCSNWLIGDWNKSDVLVMTAGLLISTSFTLYTMTPPPPMPHYALFCP